MKRTLTFSLVLGLAALALMLLTVRDIDHRQTSLRRQQLQPQALNHEQTPQRTRPARPTARVVPRSELSQRQQDRVEAALTVELVDSASGAPVPNAEVHLYVGDQIKRTTTDTLGVSRYATLALGTYALLARSEHHAPEVLDISVSKTPDLVTVRLARGHSARGTVRAQNGGPLAQVTVRALAPYLGNRHLTQTDELGHYSLHGLPSGVVQLEAQAGGFSPATQITSRHLSEGRTATIEIDFVFARGTRCKGRVVDERNRGVAGAEVAAQSTASEPIATTTADDGSFAFGALAGTEVVLSVAAMGYVQEQPVTVKLASAGNDRVILQVVRGGSLSGMVHDQNDRPCRGVYVFAERVGTTNTRYSGQAMPSKVSTDRAGRFSFGALVAGTYQCRVRCAGYRELLSPPISIGPSTVADVGVLRLAEGDVIEGVVTDTNGQPVADSRVDYRRTDVARFGDHVITDDRGHFTIHGLAADAQVVAQATANGYGQSAEQTLTVSNHARLIIAAQREVTGTVRTPTGEPFAGAWVAVMGAKQEAVRTDAKGRFTVACSGSDGVPLLIYAQGYMLRRAAAIPGSQLSIVLRHPKTDPRGRGPSITGSLVDGLGAPLASALILATPETTANPGSTSERSGLVQTVTDARGQFVLNLPGAGVWQLAAVRTGEGREVVATRQVTVSTANTELLWHVGQDHTHDGHNEN